MYNIPRLSEIGRRDLMMKKVVTALILLSMTIIIMGCNTLNGIGKDIKSLGQVIEEATD